MSLVVVPLAWFAVSVIAYGMTLSLGNMEGSIYTNGYSSAAANLVSYLFIGPMANCLGRKKLLILSFFITGVVCMLYEPLSSLHIALTYVCLALGTFGATSAFNLVYIITTEVFPTVYRGTVFGFSNMMARAGGILAPLIDEVGKKNFMYVFGALGIAGALVSLLVKETKGQVMADTAEEERRKSGLINES